MYVVSYQPSTSNENQLQKAFGRGIVQKKLFYSSKLDRIESYKGDIRELTEVQH